MTLMNIFVRFFFILSLSTATVYSYKNQLFTITTIDDRPEEYKCALYEVERNKSIAFNKDGVNIVKTFLNPETKLTELTKSPVMNNLIILYLVLINISPYRVNPRGKQKKLLSEKIILVLFIDPFDVFEKFLHSFIYGEYIEDDPTKCISNYSQEDRNNTDSLRHYVMGNFMHSELFNNKSGVHLPQSELMHRGYCELQITKDFMQTAVNAFAIFLYGAIADIYRLPADYVLRSSRAISMMKISKEKLVATWQVVRGSKNTVDITYETLEMYRPLFKFINGREIARLNLSDDRILSYIGTHEGLNRHQVGVVASKYIQINKQWSEPKYLNLMNNLLCGVPMTFMRKLAVSTCLQLSHQVFYHIRACDPLQRRFYLAMMTRTQALGKAYSWNAQDVFRLGLLLAEVDGRDLSAVNPQAMSGITAQVMLIMPPESLQYLSELQLQYIGQKPMNILRRKLKAYQDQLQLSKVGFPNTLNFLKCIITIIVTIK